MAAEFSFLCKWTVCHFCFTLFCFPLLSGNIQNLLLKIGAWVQPCSLVLLPKSQLPLRTLVNFVFFFLFLFFLSFIISFLSFSLSFFSWNSYELNVESPDSLNIHMLLSLWLYMFILNLEPVCLQRVSKVALYPFVYGWILEVILSFW